MASAAARSAASAASVASTVSKLDFSGLVKGLPDVTKLTKLNDLAKLDPNFAKQLDGLTDAQKLSKFDDLAEAGAKANKSTFLSRNANTLLTGGVVAGGVLYLDQQYADAKEAVKDCMKVCLPENWDDHEYGDLKSSELVYKELDNTGDQPVCNAQIPDCGKYCGDKCEEIHDYDAPGTNFLKGAGGDAAEGATDLFKAIFGDIFGDWDVNTGVVSASSSSSSLCCCIVIILAVVMSA